LQLSSATQHRLAWIVAAIAIAAYYPRYRHGGGASIFSRAAECLLQGQTPRHCGLLIYAYPPFFALLWVPLAQAAPWLREAVWYLVLVGTLFASLRLCETLARRLFPGVWSERELALFRTLTFVLSLKFILAVLENQAYDSIAIVFILLGLVALVSERTLLGAASLAMAAALKVTPLIFLPYLLFKRRFAAAGVFIGVVVGLTLLPDMLLPPKAGWHVTVWLRDVILAPLNVQLDFDLPFWMTDSPMNQTFRAAIVRLFTGIHQEQSHEAVFAIMKSRPFALALYGVMGLYVLSVGLVMLKSRRDDRLIAIDGALLVVSALLLTPVSSQSHFVGLMLPYALVAAALVKDPSARVFNAAMLAASFVLATATSNDAAGKVITSWALWSSLPVYGTLILVIPLGLLIWSARCKTTEILHRVHSHRQQRRLPNHNIARPGR
jgi:Glycosyltransferase family 87